MSLGPVPLNVPRNEPAVLFHPNMPPFLNLSNLAAPPPPPPPVSIEMDFNVAQAQATQPVQPPPFIKPNLQQSHFEG